MTFSWGMVQIAVHPHYEILLSNKKEQSIDTHNNMDESQMHYVN